MRDRSAFESLRAEIGLIESGQGEDMPDWLRGGSEKPDDDASQPGDDWLGFAGKPAAAEDDPVEKAVKKIIALFNASDRSERSSRERLEREGFEESAIDESVERAKRWGLIDDARFAQILVRSRLSQGKGSAGIVRDLAANGIDADEVPGWPYEFPVSYEEELERALSLLERKPPTAKNARDAAYRRLMQKGYPSSVASAAARTWHEGTRS